jgi:very-short-patch-repair endonuclease
MGIDMVKKQYHPQPNLWSKLEPVARQMRQEPTQAERILWERLRDGRLNGHKFRRQHAIDRFIVDFFCRAAALIIEIDGPIHEQQAEQDQERQQLLTELGFQFLRFTNDQVLHHLEDVLSQIIRAIDNPTIRP